jgi:hypothetical protein
MLGLGGTRPSMQYEQLNQTYQSDPRRILGQALMGQGTSSAPVRTPLAGLGRLSSALVGAYLQRKAGDAQVEREGEYRNQLASALTGLGDDIPSGISALGQIPGMEIPAITAGLNYQTTVAANQAKRPTILSSEQALALGVPQSALDRGALFQSGESGLSAVSGTAQPTTGLTPGRALEELYGLATAGDLNDEQTQRLNFLNNYVKKPRPVQVPDGAGGFTLQMVPGFDALAQLKGAAATTVDGQPPAPGDQAASDTGTGNVILGAKSAKLSEAESKFVSNLGSAQNDLKTVIDIMFNGDLQNGEYNQSSAIASGSSIGRAASGDAQRLYDAISNLVDLRLRDRTGATANESEIKNYLEAVTPGLTTRDDTQRARIARLVTELNGNIDAFKAGRNINISPIKIPELQTNNSSMTVNIPGTN